MSDFHWGSRLALLVELEDVADVGKQRTKDHDRAYSFQLLKWHASSN